MRPRIFVLILALLFPASAFADCADDVCGSLQKILQERSSNFAKLKGRPSAAPKSDQGWEGTQVIPGLINYCFVYARGGAAPYEYRCDASGPEAAAWLSVEKAKQIADNVKTAFQSADPKLVWFVDPDSLALARISGFEASEAWYGGYATNKLAVKVAIFGSSDTGTTVSVIIFAKPLANLGVR
jgi:hypothetical protein